MAKTTTQRIIEVIENKFSHSAALAVGTIIGSLITIVGGSLVFTATFGARFDTVEAAVKNIPVMQDEITQLKNNDTQKTSDISSIKTDVSSFKTEFEQYLISKSK